MTPDEPHDEPLFLSRHPSGEGEHGGVELRLQAIAETDPCRRYGRLLRGRHYGEALEYARDFGLDVAQVWRAQARDIVDKLACDAADVDELLRLLDETKDGEFGVECCREVHSSCLRLDDVRRVLQYGCDVAVRRWGV